MMATPDHRKGSDELCRVCGNPWSKHNAQEKQQCIISMRKMGSGSGIG
jgi:hypothetical protein